MEKIKKIFKNFPGSDFPGPLHGRIIKNIVFSKFKTYFAVIGGLLVLNLLVVSWRIWTKIIDAGVYTLVPALFQDFELSRSFISDLIGMVLEIVPANLIAIFAIDIFIIAYTFHFRFSLKDSILKNA